MIITSRLAHCKWTGFAGITVPPSSCTAISAVAVIYAKSLCTDSAHAGSVCHYVCNPGYRMTGSPQTECLDTGSWSHSLPSCHRELTAIFLLSCFYLSIAGLLVLNSPDLAQRPGTLPVTVVSETWFKGMCRHVTGNWRE